MTSPIDADIAAIEYELAQVRARDEAPEEVTQKLKRTPLPEYLPRNVIHHELDTTQRGCGCDMTSIGEDVAEKLDYVPGVFTVDRHIRGKWLFVNAGALHAPVPVQIIGKGIPSAGLLAHVLVPSTPVIYRCIAKRIFLVVLVRRCHARLQPLVDALLTNGVLYAFETPIQVLEPAKKKTHCAYLWAY